MIFDCMIVGAGPAGTFCGYDLARSGYSCVILERLPRYGEKVCGGWLPNIALQELRNAGIDISSLGDNAGIRTKSCRTVRGGEESVYRYKEDIYGLGITRKDLDTFLSDQAVKAGAVLVFDQTVRDISCQDGLYEANGYQARSLVMASGARGFFTGNVPGYENQSFGVSAQIHAKSDLDNTEVVFWYADESAVDYFWAIPIGKDSWNIGYWMQKAAPDIEERFRAGFETYMAPHLQSYSIIQPLRGAFLGNTDLCGALSVKAFAAGDFAGVNNYMTGEGLSFAFRSAREAARKVRKTLFGTRYERIEIIRGEEANAVFLCDRLEHVGISSEEADAFSDLLGGYAPGEAAKRNGIPEERWEILTERIAKKDSIPLPAEVKTDSVRLTFNVSNCCNMACRYCYANGGTYLSDEKQMSIETAKKALDLFHAKFKKITSIKFIGGEPAMNLPVVEYICDYEKRLVDNGTIGKLPEFIFVTNGTFVNRRLIDLALNYDMKIGFSIDAPDEINDRVRVMKDGSGSSRIVRENIRRLQKATNGREPYSVNAVYTHAEEEAGLSIDRIVHYFRDELGIPSAHVIPVDPKDGSPYELQSNQAFVEAADRLLREWRESGDPVFFNNLKGIVRKLEKRMISPDYICDAGFGLFSVSCDGDIYPCHLFTDVTDYKLGNVDDDLFGNDTFLSRTREWESFNRRQSEPCRSCFGNRLCIGCLGANYFRTGNERTPSPFICDMFRKVLSRVILEFVIQGKESGERKDYGKQ